MSKAGPLTGSVSRSFRSAGAGAAENDHANAVQAPYNTPAFEPHGGFGSRRHCDEIVIGLALGSPGQSPLPLLPSGDRDLIADVYDVENSHENTTITLEDLSEINADKKGIKRKASKWKSLRSFWGRREIRSPSPFYHPDQKEQTGPARQVITQDDLETNALRGKRANSSHGTKARRADTSTGMPGQDLLRRNSSRRRGLRRKKVEPPQPDTQRSPTKYTENKIADNLGSSQDLQRSLTPRPSFLQVEIPCVELERYSVMFGDVLEPHVRQSKPQTSLLARRKGHLEELHAVAGSYCEVRSPCTRGEKTYRLTATLQPFDLDLPKTTIRADSMSSESSRSPSFSLFPSTPLPARSPVSKLLPKSSPLGRSVTAPSGHIFPHRPTIKKSNSQDRNHVLVIVHNSEASPTSHVRQPSSDPFQRSPKSTKASFLECADHPRYSATVIQANSPIPTEDAAQEPLHRAFPARKSSMKRLASPEPLYKHQAENLISPATEVAVARQISISRRQRQLLVPIISKTTHQPMQPRTNEQTTMEASRKSHHLNLEDA